MENENIQNIMQEIGINNDFYSCTKDNITLYFNKIADYLFFKNVIRINDKEFQITEIEFYYYNNDNERHKDPFVHKHELQKQFGKWYFHGSGIDFTFGDENTQTYCGVLLRSIIKAGETTQEHFVDGPILLLRKLFENLSLFDKNDICIEKKIDDFPKEDPYKGKRIGLELEIDEKKIELINTQKDFIDLPYRYAIRKNLTRKHPLK